MVPYQMLQKLSQHLWTEAFKEGRRIGIIEDGIYHIPTDVDCMLMYCMGQEL